MKNIFGHLKTAGAAAVAASTILLAAGTSGQAQGYPYRLVVVNNCHATISVARRVKDPSGRWVTRGWMNVPPGETRSRMLQTHNRVFYLFAIGGNGRYLWSGRGRNGSISRPVVSRRFVHFSGRLYGPNRRHVRFAMKRIPHDKTGFRQSYNCDA